MASKAKVLIFIVSFNAEAFIKGVLDRIPESIWNNQAYDTELLVIDDQSSDKTFDRIIAYTNAHPCIKAEILYNPVNQGYGGNQKLGYHYAVDRGLFMWDGQGYYCDERCLPDTAHSRWTLMVLGANYDVPKISSQLDEAGITHLLLTKDSDFIFKHDPENQNVQAANFFCSSTESNVRIWYIVIIGALFTN